MKKVFYNSIIVCVKDVKYIYWVRKDWFGCFSIEENATMAIEQV